MKSIFKRAAFISLVSAGLLMAEPFVLDKGHSSVGFSVKHMMITNVTGNFKDFSGELDFDTKKKSFNSLSGTIKATTVDTGIEKRDEHLRSADFFEVEKFPDITFKMTSYKAKGDDGEMEGELTIKGVTKKVKLQTEIGGLIKDLQGDTRVGFTLSGKISRKDFGLTWNKALETGGVVVGDDVKLTIEAQAKVKE